MSSHVLHNAPAGDGRAAARHLLAWGRDQHCPDPEALAADMEMLFRGEAERG